MTTDNKMRLAAEDDTQLMVEGSTINANANQFYGFYDMSDHILYRMYAIYTADVTGIS